VVVGDRSAASAPDMTAMVGTAATAPIGSSAGASSSRPQMGAAFTMAVDGNDIMEEPEVILRHPLFRAPGDASLDEAMGIAHWVLNQAHEVLHLECDDVYAEHQCLLLWASMLKKRIASKRVRAHVQQWHLERRWAAINELDTASQKVLSNAKEIYASAEACVNTTIQQMEEFAMCVSVVAEQE
jgi:hypothetical protein